MAEQRFPFSYAVFRYVKDAKRDLSIPVGVALWSQDLAWARVRFTRWSVPSVSVFKFDDPHWPLPLMNFNEQAPQTIVTDSPASISAPETTLHPSADTA